MRCVEATHRSTGCQWQSISSNWADSMDLWYRQYNVVSSDTTCIEAAYLLDLM